MYRGSERISQWTPVAPQNLPLTLVALSLIYPMISPLQGFTYFTMMINYSRLFNSFFIFWVIMYILHNWQISSVSFDEFRLTHTPEQRKPWNYPVKVLQAPSHPTSTAQRKALSWGFSATDEKPTVMCVLRCKASFTQPSAPEIHPGGSSSLSPFMLSIWSHEHTTACLFCWWTPGLFLVLGYIKKLVMSIFYVFSWTYVFSSLG